MKKIIFALLVIAGGAIALSGCIKDQPDEPPATTIPYDPGKVLTLGQVKNLYVDNGGAYTFTEDYSVFATVVMDEESGNIYRSSYVQDGTGGIQLNFLNPGGLYLGDSVRIWLKGATVDKYYGLYQINDMDVGTNIVKLATNRFIEPTVVNIPELITQIPYYQSTLIQVNDVQFVESYLGGTFADSVGRQDVNVAIRDCMYGEVYVRTSGYANFANRTLPTGRGDLVAIATLYSRGSTTDIQLVIRSYDEVNFDQARCEPGSGGNIIFAENFDEGWGGWTTISKYGQQQWSRDNNLGEDGSPCAVINGFEFGYYQNEDWLISPAIDVSNLDIMTVSFASAKNYDGEDIAVYVSESPDFSTYLAVGNSLYQLSSGSFKWTESGYINLSSYFDSGTSEIYIGFRYQSTSTEAAEWRIDNVTVKGE